MLSEKNEHTEGPIAKTIEKQTAKLPSDTFLWLSLGAMGFSAALQLSGRKETSNFVGQWAPTLLILGLYNKLVKIAGSDRSESMGGTTLGQQEQGGRVGTSIEGGQPGVAA